MLLFSQIFLLFLGAGLLLQLWLIARHKRQISHHRGAVPGAFSDNITLAQHQKAADYTLTKLSLGRIELLVTTTLLLGWTMGGGIELLVDLLGQFSDQPILFGLLLILLFSLISGIIDLPLALWRTFVIEQRFGFNRTTPRQFIKDLCLQTLVSLIIGTPLLAAVLWLMGAAGEFWWLYAWALLITYMLLMSWAYPTLIAPLFNDFTELPEGPLRQRIQALLGRCGFTSSGIFIMDGSKRSGHGNAYFTGFGRSKRIVFFDTLVESLSEEELEAVLAHELGHFKYRHIFKQLLLSALLSLGGLALLGWLAKAEWFYHSLGVAEQGDAIALLLFMLVVPVFSQFLSPLLAMLSRHHEFQADAFAVEQTGVKPMTSALVKLYRENASTLTPDPLYSAFHDSHPPAPVRIGRMTDTADQRLTPRENAV